MNKELMEKLINNMLETGADYSEVYYEDRKYKLYDYLNGKLNAIDNLNKKGIGLRIIKGGSQVYGCTNNLSSDNLIKLSDKLKENFIGNKRGYIKLDNEIVIKSKIKIKHNEFSTSKKLNIMKKINDLARGYSNLISNVRVYLIEDERYKEIYNSFGVITKNTETRTRLFITVFAKRDDNEVSSYIQKTKYQGYEIFDEINLESLVKDACDDAIEKLDMVNFKGGEYPVIISSGFGAVIFHESCGHALEATNVAVNKSVLGGKLNTKIASDKVTLIDDATMENMWGSTFISDEGELSRKNVLIENGILKSYLVDRFHSTMMNHKSNGCARRESYMYEPTSRMSNTHLAPGRDKIEDMFKSIDYGVYVKSVSSGSADAATGNFNFVTNGAYIIENGKIIKRIKDTTLMGKMDETLNNIEMVSDDLKFEGGYCSSASGNIYITAGMPTIKVSKLLVGGSSNE